MRISRILRDQEEKIPEAEKEAPVSGCFCEVIGGPHSGRVGVYIADADAGKIVIRTRDSKEDHLVLDSSQTRPVTAGRR
jgi:hypothetical protein